MPCCVRAVYPFIPAVWLQQQQEKRLFSEFAGAWLPTAILSPPSNPASSAAVLTGASGHGPARCLLLHIAGSSSNYQKIVTNCLTFGWWSFWTKNVVQLILNGSCISVTEDAVFYQALWSLQCAERGEILRVPKSIANSHCIIVPSPISTLKDHLSLNKVTCTKSLVQD